MKKIIYSIITLLIVITTSCSYGYDDKSSDMPDITITNMTETGVVPTQMFIGDTLSISPKVVCGKDTSFVYHWYKQGSSSLKLISRNQSLSYRIDSLGAWTIRLEVTDKKTNIMQSATVYTNVTSRSQRGWYVLKETTDGNTDMDLYRITSAGVYDGAEKDVLKSAGSELQGKPKSLTFIDNYDWKAPGASYYTSYIPVLLPVSEKGTAAFRMSDERILSNGNGMFFESSEGNNCSLEGAITTETQSVLIDGGKAHIMKQGMQAFLPPMTGTYSLAPYFSIGTGSSCYMLGFDNTSHSFVYATLLAGTLSTFPDSYLPKNCKISSNNMNGTISFMENTNGTLNPDTDYEQRAYAIFNETGHTDRCILLGLDLAQTDPNQYEYGNAQYSPIMFADTLSYNDYPQLKTAQVLALHKNYPMIYMANGNKISSLLISSNKFTDGVLTYPADETVTYMHYTVCDYDTYTFNNFVVATYNQSTGKYKIYIYNVAGNEIEQQGNAYTGDGKVKSMIFASPSSYAWNTYIYSCY